MKNVQYNCHFIGHYVIVCVICIESVIFWDHYSRPPSDFIKIHPPWNVVGYEFVGQSTQSVEIRDVYNFHSILRHINSSENSPHRVKCHKITTIYPQPIRRHYHPKYTFITLAPFSYLRSLVVRAVHRHRTGV